jgi:hypothetical protein
MCFRVLVGRLGPGWFAFLLYQDVTREATISMVEGNRNTFQLSDAELQSRKRFVTDSRRTLEDLQKDENFEIGDLWC